MGIWYYVPSIGAPVAPAPNRHWFRGDLGTTGGTGGAMTWTDQINGHILAQAPGVDTAPLIQNNPAMGNQKGVLYDGLSNATLNLALGTLYSMRELTMMTIYHPKGQSNRSYQSAGLLWSPNFIQHYTLKNAQNVIQNSSNNSYDNTIVVPNGTYNPRFQLTTFDSSSGVQQSRHYYNGITPSVNNGSVWDPNYKAIFLGCFRVNTVRYGYLDGYGNVFL